MPTILVVDDSAVVRVAARRILDPLGFTVCEAVDGSSALEHCRSAGSPDAILLDVVMPDVNGVAVLRALRADPRFQQCVVIMCTTRAEPEDIRAALEAGANEYVMKPFTSEILVDKLRATGVLP
jgi:two-component system chemotaxis response regulator CheY